MTPSAKKESVMFIATFYLASLLVGVVVGLVIANRIESSPHFA